MIWKVTFRRTDGTTGCESVEAGSRKEIFGLFAKRGVSVLSVECLGNSSERPVRSKAPRRARKVVATAALAIVLVAAIVFVALRFFAGNKAPLEKPSPKQSKQIETVPYQKRTVVTPIVTNDSASASVPAELPPQKVGEVRNGTILMPNGELHVIKGEVTNTFSRSKGKWAIFNNASENVIAATLCTVPGETLMGTVRFNGNFKKSFLKSLTTPIVVHEDDPDDVKALKRAVIEAKITLKEAYDRGEDIEQIIIDSREESQRMSQYKQQLKSNLFRVAKDANSTEDIDDALEAANLMLEQKGISPIEAGPLTRIKMKLMMNNQEVSEDK